MSSILVQCPKCKKLFGMSKVLSREIRCKNPECDGYDQRISVDKRIYYAQWRDPDGRTRQKKIGPHKEAAENFLREIDTAIVEKRYIKRHVVKKVKIKDFIDNRYQPWCESRSRGSGLKTKLVHLKKIKELWGDRNLDELTGKDVDDFRATMKGEEKTTMFNRVFTTLAHLYSIAVEDGDIQCPPFSTKRMKFTEKRRLRYLRPDEVNRLIDACAEHLRPIVITAVHTGARKEEILSLRLGIEVNLKERSIHLTKTKNDEERFIPINETLLATLTALAEGKQAGDYLFTWQGKRILDVKTAFHTALAAAAIVNPNEERVKDFHFHDLRHTFASNLVMNGVSLYEIKELLGHKDIKMTMIYAELSKKHKAKVVTILDRVFAREASEDAEKITPTHPSGISQTATQATR